MGLVEEGSIDAVIGVSCMPVLQRSFDPVSNAAVPVIGLPLMYDGCENTQIDMEWLMDEIMVFNQDENYEPISTHGIKAKINDFFANGKLDVYLPGNDHTEKLAKEYLQIGGKRMRPVLAALSYTAYAGPESGEIIFPSSLIIESFHKASLIHDDIEDNADFRYGVETTESTSPVEDLALLLIKNELDHSFKKKSAALVYARRMLGLNTKNRQKNLLNFLVDGGGFGAFEASETADTLSTGVALFVLRETAYDMRVIKPACLDFVKNHYLEGAFLSGDGDLTRDLEYTFYGLLALGSLVND